MPEWSEVTGDVDIQPVYGDLKLQKAAGGSTAATPRFLAGVMGNVMEQTVADGLTKTKNIVAGVIGKNDIQGTNSSTYPSAGVIGEVGDLSKATYAVLAVFGGDTPGTGPTPVAMFGVDWQNSTLSAKAQFGLDLQGNGVHDSYATPNYTTAHIRLGGRRNSVAGGDDVLITTIAAAPTNGTSGTLAGFAGPGSLLIRTDTPTLYQNTNTKASPTWTAQV